MEKNNKKAAMTVNQIISVVLIIVGFGILLIFLVRIDWGQSTTRSVCHESVILRATLPDALSSYSPLRCRTIKYCIASPGILDTFQKPDCSEDFGNIDGITTVKVRSAQELEKFYAQEILECWSMMGEGKVSLFTKVSEKFSLGEVYPSCVICSRIAFDKNFDKDLLNEVNLPLYLSTHKAPGKDYTYAQYLQGESNLIGIGSNIGKVSLDDAINQLKASGQEEIKLTDIETNDLSQENAILFMQINAANHGDVIKEDLLATGLTMGVSYVFAPKITKISAVSSFRNPIAWILAIGFFTYQQGMVANNRAVAAGYCSDALTGPGARGGCSVVRTTNYNVEGISGYCENIESIM